MTSVLRELPLSHAVLSGGSRGQRKKWFKTVEILVAERDWEPPRPRFAHDQIVDLRVAFAEVEVRERRESPCRCPGAIQIEMLASNVGCCHPVADDGAAVEF
jgi:hypothetical protein